MSAPVAFAGGAIALWATLAALGVSLGHVPPFLLTGVALLIGSLLALPAVVNNPRVWAVSPAALATGVYGVFGYHFLFFVALQNAPAVEANLVNYLWPLLIVVLAPVLLAGVRLKPLHLVAAVMGFAGAAVAILGGSGTTVTGTGGRQAVGGYLAAGGAAFIWASYSLLTQRAERLGHQVPTAAVGLFGAVSGTLSLLCHWAFEPPATLVLQDWLLLAVLGLGPLGAAFFMWDRAMKQGDARHIGILSYATPLLSTTLLVLTSGRPLTASIALSAVLILSAAVLGTRAR